jgi:glycosyltransferase involved in cell wall biosynthesis
LIYNWLPFDNPWNWGGGVTVYCKNIIEGILKILPNINIYFLSSGFAYSAKEDYTYVRKIGNIFGERVHQYEIVNSPVPAEQRWMYVNPLVALENSELKAVVTEFMKKYGPFEAVHFNNIEGLSLDVLDLKENYPKTKYIFSIHNYVPICVNGSYYMRHKHCNCNPNHTGQDCFKCTRADIRKNIAEEQYKRGLYGHASSECISQGRWIKKFGFERLDQDVSVDEILDFQKTAVEKINKNCDEILAVSKRVYDIAEENGLGAGKMRVSYIGTKVAEHQSGHSTAKTEDGLKIVFLGNDINYEEKGYPFLLDTLSKLEYKYASKIDILLTVKQAEHAEIYTMLKNFRNVKVIQGYTHSDLPWIFEGANLSIVPVLWEDNLPQIAIESVAYGVPVLASSAGGASELCDSDLFRFECGNSEDMLLKLCHFIERPEDLSQYWDYHHGLVTIKEHCMELLKVYGLSGKKIMIEISEEDWGWLLKEHDFLQKNFKGNHEEGEYENEHLQKVNEELLRQKEEAERQRDDLQFHLDETRKSKTYKIGRAITYIPRKIRGEKGI